MGLNLSDTPLVSIVCLAYNHAKYIREAIDGFLIQKTNFRFEILIHDDASTDGTTVIVKEYADKHKNLIIPILQAENQWSKGVRRILATFVFPKCKGKYIAICEGDDYWTDPLKLQQQVDFLEKNNDFSICFHKVKLNISGRIKKDYLTRVPKKISTAIDLARFGNYIHTCSCVFRNRKEILNKIPNNIKVGDYALHLLNTANGEKIWFLNETMAVYRVHPTGMMRGSSSGTNVKNELQFYARLAECLPETISSFLLYRFFLVFTNNFRTIHEHTEKEEFIEFTLDLLPNLNRKTLLSIFLFKTELESNRNIAHILKGKLINLLKPKRTTNG